MNLITAFLLPFVLLVTGLAHAEWPMSNDPAFDPAVQNPAYPESTGPRILLDGAHHNFFIQWDFIKPFASVARADGYRPVIGEEAFTQEYLAGFDIVVIITALPFDFTTKTEVTTESTFTDDEISALHDWVAGGGSLLVFSEHAPLDQAINPLLQRFGMSSSIGYVVDHEHADKSFGKPGWIVFSRENGLLNVEHPIIQGRNDSEAIASVVTFGGSSLSGEGYTNLFRLSASAKNEMHSTGVGPIGMGTSQALAGKFGEGKIVAFGDSNGFTAMIFTGEDGSTTPAGMNIDHYDWKQLVLNVLHWLSQDQPNK
jgi:hypothetical protein